MAAWKGCRTESEDTDYAREHTVHFLGVKAVDGLGRALVVKRVWGRDRANLCRQGRRTEFV